jgi:hypothetical protein
LGTYFRKDFTQKFQHNCVSTDFQLFLVKSDCLLASCEAQIDFTIFPTNLTWAAEPKADTIYAEIVHHIEPSSDLLPICCHSATAAEIRKETWNDHAVLLNDMYRLRLEKGRAAAKDTETAPAVVEATAKLKFEV